MTQVKQIEIAEREDKEPVGTSRVGRFLGRIIFYSLLILIVLTAIPYGTVEPWWEALFECGVLVLVALWSIGGLIGERLLVSSHRLLVPLFALIAFAFFQILPLFSGSVQALNDQGGGRRALSSDPYETRLAIFNVLAIALVGGLLLRYSTTERRLRILLHTVIGISVASALFGLARQAMQHEPGFFLPNLRPDKGYGQFINHSHFAFLMEMGLGLSLGLIIGRGIRSLPHLIYLIVASVLMWTALVLSGSRGGILGMMCQVVFLTLLFSILYPARKSANRSDNLSSKLLHFGQLLVFRIILIVCLVVAIFIGVVWMGGDPFVDRLESMPVELSGRYSDRYTNTLRPKMWRATWELIKDNPIAGVGFGGYWIAITKYHQASGEFTPQQAHNDYLELLASGGVIGAALGLWFAVSVMRVARVRLRSVDPFRRAVNMGALAGIFSIAVHSFFDFGLHIPINALVFTALLVLITVDEPVKEQTHTSKTLLT